MFACEECILARAFVFGSKRYTEWSFLTVYPFCVATFGKNVTFQKVFVANGKARMLIL